MTILQTITPVTHDLGQFEVRRVLPSAQKRMVGPFIFVDQFGPAHLASGEGMGVRPHPHINLATVTWLFDGEYAGAIEHRDSLGSFATIRPGQVNLMTAGRGVAHSEDSVRDGANLHAAQLWIALPEAERQREPAFCNYADLPVLQADGFRITVLAGTVLGQTAPTRVYSPLCGVDLSCDGPARTTLPLDPAFEYGALVLRGEATLAGERLPADELLFFPAGRHELSLQADGPAEILLLGGEPFGEAIILWWNFVGRTHQDMEQALADWNAHPNTGGRFGTVKPGCLASPLNAPSLEGVHLKPGA